MERLTVVINNEGIKESLSLLFFEHNDQFVSYIVADGSAPKNHFSNISFEVLVNEVKEYLETLGTFEINDANGFDATTRGMLNRLRN